MRRLKYISISESSKKRSNLKDLYFSKAGMYKNVIILK